MKNQTQSASARMRDRFHNSPLYPGKPAVFGTQPNQVNLDTPALLSFITGARKITQDHFHQWCPNSVARGMGINVAVDNAGERYLRVVRFDTQDGQRDALGSRSSHCFIDRRNGDVLKSSSWKTPAKGARGNLFDANNGLGRMGPFGPGYNR